MDIKALEIVNAEYKCLEPKDRLKRIFKDFEQVLATSSFGTTSAILLHLIHKVKPKHPIYFIDTRFLFRETYKYRQELIERWKLNVVSVNPKMNEHDHTALDWTWTYQPDACCHVNKVEPLTRLKSRHDVWISGMIGGTTKLRSEMPMFKHDGEILRFYPLIDMGEQEAEWYKLIYELPKHPLEEQGYGSVGCEQCTLKGTGRSGRWAGKEKTECGLHLFQVSDDSSSDITR